MTWRPFSMHILALAVAISSVASTGCTEMRPVRPASPPTQPPSWSLKSGDHVRLLLATGQQVQITVRAVEADAIVSSDGTRYSLADIRSVDHRRFSVKRTGGLVLAIYGAFAVLVAVALAAAYH